VEYLAYGSESYPLMAIRSRDWRDDLPVVLITGGVHGYETTARCSLSISVRRITQAASTCWLRPFVIVH
jgi:hypothetical protein